MSSYLETENLSVGYSKKALIEEISLKIEKGQIVTLIGPNGSGKSTILKSITKQLEIIKGSVFIGRSDIKSMSYKELAKKQAVVLTERIKPELMTCRDVVASGRYPFTGRMGLLSKEDEAIVDRVMEQVHVLELSDRDFQEVSDGQRQRILLARALCQEPEIIVLDEPTSYLDIRHKIELLGILRDMAKNNGTTIIMSLHEIDLAQKISDIIICVDGDRIAGYGEPDEILKQEFIAGLYGIEEENYNTYFGSIELAKPEGVPETFVISGCGSGINTFRELQKQGIPFYAGILYTNDIDYQVARALATEVVTAEPFCRITDDSLERAFALMRRCKRIIYCPFTLGESNSKLQLLIDKANEFKN